MKFKPLVIFLISSTVFLLCLISIWKIMSTLQGLNLTNLDIIENFFLSILLVILFLIIGQKLNHLIKVLLLSFLFFFTYFLINETAPFWYYTGIFLITTFFINRLKKYNTNFLKEDFVSEKIIFDFISLFGIVFFAFVILFPFYIMFVTSFKTQIALLVNPLDFSIDFSKNLFDLFKSYFVIFKTYSFGRYILISSLVSIGTVIITLLFAIPAAYAVARLNFFGKTFLSTSILIIYMFPAIVLVIPLYTVFSQLGLRNSVEGLLIVYTATTLPVAIYMLQGYFKSIPREIEDAGIMDGQSWFGIIIKIIIPLSLPAIASVALYVFMIAWNDLFSLMFLDNPKSFTSITCHSIFKWRRRDTKTISNGRFSRSYFAGTPYICLF